MSIQKTRMHSPTSAFTKYTPPQPRPAGGEGVEEDPLDYQAPKWEQPTKDIDENNNDGDFCTVL